MDLRAAARPSPRRTWVLAVLGVGVWTALVALLAGAYVVEATSESVPAISQWSDVADGLAITTLLAALAVTASLRRRDAGAWQLVLAAPLLVLVPQVVVAVRVAVLWRAEAPELPLAGAVSPSVTPVGAGLGAYVGAVAAGGLRLLPLVLLAGVLGRLAGRLGSAGGLVVAAAWVTALVATTEVSGTPSYAATRPDSGLRTAMEVVVTGEPEPFVPQTDVGCHPPGGSRCAARTCRWARRTCIPRPRCWRSRRSRSPGRGSWTRPPARPCATPGGTRTTGPRTMTARARPGRRVGA